MFNKNLQFIFCSFFPVGLEDYVEFFKANFSEFVYLKWKFPHSRDKKAISALEYYRSGHLFKQKKLFSFSLAGSKLYFLFLPINYLIYFWQSLFLLFIPKKDKKIVFMGINYFCAFCGIILKKLGKVDFVIYRVMDFFPLPPSGVYRILNRIFYLFDKFCLTNADSVWFTTKGHIIGREKYGYFDRKKFPYEIIPLAININKFLSLPVTKENQHSLVYCGVVSKYQMLDLVFEILQILKKEFTDIKFNLIGSGPDIDYYKKLAGDMNLEKNIIFHGFMEEGEKFSHLMADNALGVALYKDEENYMKYTEPAKVKYYLNFGIPAIVSKVPKIAEELDKIKASFAVNNKAEEIAEVIRKYFKSEKMQKEYRDNIKKFAQTVEVNKLLQEKLEKTL